MTIPETLEALGLLVAPENITATVVRFNTSRNSNRVGNQGSWPDDELCVKGARVAKEGGLDRSRADFVGGLMAAQRGYTIEDTSIGERACFVKSFHAGTVRAGDGEMEKAFSC
jgi:hypothetical protein